MKKGVATGIRIGGRSGGVYRVVSPVYIPNNFKTLDGAKRARERLVETMKTLRDGSVVELSHGRWFVAFRRHWKRPRVFVDRSAAVRAVRSSMVVSQETIELVNELPPHVEPHCELLGGGCF